MVQAVPASPQLVPSEAWFAWQLPEQSHRPGECRHCDALRRLVGQANELLDALTTQYVTPN